MICVYDSRETDFTHNGLGVLRDTKRCEVVEEANGSYNLTLEYPITADGRWKLLEQNNIIKAHTPKNGEQLFRILKKTKINRNIHVYAVHIFYDLIDNFLEDCRPTQQNGIGALNWILNGTKEAHRFTGFSDIATVASAGYIRKNPVGALMGEENCFLNRWGGELERNNFEIKIMAQAGADRGVSIQYGKNLLGIEEDLDIQGVVTLLYLTGLNENDQVVVLPEKYIQSQYIANYPYSKIKPLHYSNFKVNPAEGITLENVYTMLRNEARRLYDVDKIDIPRVNYKVNFIELSKTEEYKNYAILEQVYLYDTVTIKHSKLGIDLKAKVISYKYDAVNKKYLEIELGNFKENISKSFQSIEKNIIKVNQDITQVKSDYQKAIDNATDKIAGNTGGYIHIKRNAAGQPQEILVMDTSDVNTAKQCIRINQEGIGGSITGVNGPFNLGLLIDGTINATMIVTGILNADLLQIGTITSKDGSISINLANGTFTIGGNGSVAMHTREYSKFMHPNGSYTKIGWDGLERFINGQSKRYKYLIHIAEVTVTALNEYSVVGIAEINLPSEFAGVEVEAFAMLSEAYNTKQAVIACLNKVQTSSVTKKVLNNAVSFGYNVTFNERCDPYAKFTVIVIA